MQNHSYENEFHLHVHFNANQTCFHLNGFAQGLFLKTRQRATGKWPIAFSCLVVTNYVLQYEKTNTLDKLNSDIVLTIKLTETNPRFN